jgi:hypothetical protein
MYIKKVTARASFRSNITPFGFDSCHRFLLTDVFARSLLQVVIEGFKSYREETSTEPFSPKVNVVGNLLLFPL